MNQDARGQAHPAPFFCVVFPPPPQEVFPLAKAPLKAWESPQITAEQRDGKVNAGGSGDGHCRQWSSLASVRLTLGLGMVGNHSCFIPWEHPSTAPLQTEPAFTEGLSLV